MKKVIALFFAAALMFSIYLGENTVIRAEVPAAGQVVTKTKEVTKKTYHKGHEIADSTVNHGKKYSKKAYSKGRWVTVTTWKHGKKYTKKVWKKGNSIGHKTASKTKEVVMGPKKRTP